jgi:hypothetical protein
MRPAHQAKEPGSLATRILWFVGLWLAGVGAVALAALLIRAILTAA